MALFKSVEDLLRSRIGLDAKSIGVSALEGAVRSRMQACGKDAAAYAAHLGSHASEVELLIEEIVVRETWFFREFPAFELLCQRVLAAVAGRSAPFRILSIPCSTGEEPYSIAIALLAAGVKPASFEVAAVDVSAQALHAARTAVYGKNSFRSAQPDYAHYFEATPEGARVLAHVRERVQFSHGNVLDPWLHAGRQFDAVFCRNLLIYLDTDARLAALRNLRRLLHADGILFAGHSEAVELMSFGLRRVGEARSFAFSLPDGPEDKNAPKRRPTPLRVKVVNAVDPGAKPRARPASGQLPRAEPRPPAPGAGRLEDARSLADRGQLSAARERCEASLATAPSADGYCLLGILKKTAGDLAGAAEAFNKALYLDAAHYDALVQLALLFDNSGDRAAAEKLRSRAERAALRAERKEDA